MDHYIDSISIDCIASARSVTRPQLGKLFGTPIWQFRAFMRRRPKDADTEGRQPSDRSPIPNQDGCPAPHRTSSPPIVRRIVNRLSPTGSAFGDLQVESNTFAVD